MKLTRKCPKCGGNMSEAHDLIPAGRGRMYLGDLYLYCCDGDEDCGTETVRYTDSDAAFAKWERGELPLLNKAAA